MKNKNEVNKQLEMNRNKNRNLNNQTQLAKESELLNALIDNIPDNIYFKDLESKFTRINKAQAKVLGLEGTEEAVGKTDMDYFTKEHAKAAMEDERRIVETEIPLINKIEKIRRADGEFRWVSATKVPIKDNRGQITGIVGISRDITESKQVEEKLSKERNLLRTIIDNVPDYIYVKDSEGRFIVGNNAVVRQMELKSLDELIGKSDFDLFPHELAAQYYATEQEIIKSGKGMYDLEGPTVDANKEEQNRWVSTNKVPFRDAQGKIVGFVGLGRDITKHKQAEEKIKHLNDVLRAIRNVNQLIAREKDRDHLIKGVCDCLTESLGYNSSWIALFDKSKKFTKAAEAGWGDNFIHFKKQLRKDKLPDFIERALKKTGITVIRDASSLLSRYFLSDKHVDDAIMIVRLKHGDTIYGLLSVTTPKDMAEDKEERMLFQEVANDIAFALYNIELEDKRKKADEALQYEKKLMDSVMDNIPDFIYFKDREGKFIRVSKAKAEEVGEDTESIIGKTDFDHFPEGEASRKFEDEKLIMEKEEPIISLEEKATRPGGEEFWVSTTKLPRYDEEGNIVGTFGISRDITQLKQVEDKLSRERSLLRTLIDNLPDLIYAKDLDSRFILGNIAVANLMGLKTPNELINKTDFDFYPKEIAIQYYADEQNLIKSGQPIINKEEPLVDQVTGKRGWLLTSKVHLRDNYGNIIGIVGIGRDITEHKKARDAVEESQQKFERMFNGNPEPAIYLDKHYHIIDINPRFTEAFGYTLDEIKNKHINKVLVPDENIQEAVTLDEKAKEGYLYYDTLRKRKDGTLVPVSISASPIIVSGKLSNYFAIYKDITKQKRAEDINFALYSISKAVQSTTSLKELFQSIHKSISNIIDSINFHIALIDKERNILTVPYCVDEKDEYKDLQLYGSKSAVEKIVESGKSLLMRKNDFQREISEGTLKLHGSLPEVWLGILLIAKNEIIGIMSLQSYSNPEAYSEKDIKLMESISEQVALAIQYKRAEGEKEKLIDDLQKALSDVKRLSGLIPICANCKKIRDDKGYWADVEKYISERSDVDFTHGICPDCMKKLYPDIYEKIYSSKSKANNIKE